MSEIKLTDIHFFNRNLLCVLALSSQIIGVAVFGVVFFLTRQMHSYI